MSSYWRTTLTTTFAIAFLVSPAFASDPGVSLIGVGFVSGKARDLSGLSGKICVIDDATNCIDQQTLGGFGSALAYTGHDNVFIAVNDRGPFDGRVDRPYPTRFHFFHITVDPAASFPNINATLLDTRLLKNEFGQNLLGNSSAFDASNQLASLRFDPEGICVSNNGTFFISDEYGPYVFEFDRQGHLLRRLPVPSKFSISHPTSSIYDDGTSREVDPALNTSGRQANRGMEGLAITPQGDILVGMMQNALIQDNGLSAPADSSTPPGRLGLNNRILTIDAVTGAAREYVYTLDAINQGKGVNDLVAVNDHQFLAIERDNRSLAPTPPNAPQTPNLKSIYLIDLSKRGLTDVSGIAKLPATAAGLATMSPPVVAVDKRLLINLLDPDYKVSATQTLKDVIAEKIEGLAFGPDLPDGRHVLYVISDNDLYPELPTKIYAFAIDGGKAGIQYQPQVLPGPLFPPGQVRQALKPPK